MHQTVETSDFPTKQKMRGGDEMAMKVEMRPTTSIKIGDRVRADLGDLNELIESLRERGLINPITVAKDGTLIAGARRLAAAKELEWVQVPVHVWRPGTASEILAVERDENTCRLALTPGEEEQTWQRYRELIAAERQAADNGNKPDGHVPVDHELTISEEAARLVGPSQDTLRRTQFVRKTAEDGTQPLDVRKVAEAEHSKLMAGMTTPGEAASTVKIEKKRADNLTRYRDEKRAKTRAAMVPGQTLRSDEPKPPPKRADWTGRLWEAVGKAAGPISLENLTEQLAGQPIQDVDVKADDLTRMADLLQAQIRHRQELRKLLLNIKKGRK